MANDICPYVFCTKCKSSKSWVRDEAKDVKSQDSGKILWKGWRCKFCGDTTLEPTEAVMKSKMEAL